MKRRDIASVAKNAMGTVFLLAGAFFVCSTFLSMRAVLADPIATAITPVQTNASPRANSTNRTSGRAVNRGISAETVARTTNRVAGTTNASRGVVSRTTTGAVSRTTGTTDRAVSSRTTSPRTVSRNVVARDASTSSRVSLTGTAINGNRGSKANVVNSYTYLSKLYTGNYSSIIDSSTGLISADAYNNCMESYYACMDEICTARNAAQRRCACAGRVKAFAEAENALETANEELIKAAGELALFIANKGKDVSDAFQLTEAEQVMNCVSWKDASAKSKVISSTNKYKEGGKEYTSGEEYMTAWCQAHSLYDSSKCSASAKPDYCTDNSFGFNIDDIDGSSSDILASLQSYANAKQETITILSEDNDNLFGKLSEVSSALSALSGISMDGVLATSDEVKDSLAETWGYELFEYAHNNVCARVLDMCFNGIYEACGTPPSSGRKCGNGASQCPYNYNSWISVDKTSGEYKLDFITPNTGYTSSNSATCFGYSSSSGDPYSSLRGPVADARRSIMQKYALDANADCDAYGEQLRKTAQNIGYQKVAAQQSLQQKRLQFANEERESVRSKAITAATNFSECLSEIYECYETQAAAHGTSSSNAWSDSRIKTYCAQVANVPHCYEDMICNPASETFYAIIDLPDNKDCKYSSDYTKNTCRNVVTLNEILKRVETAADAVPTEGDTVNSAALREKCLNDNGVSAIRNWPNN